MRVFDFFAGGGCFSTAASELEGVEAVAARPAVARRTNDLHSKLHFTQNEEDSARTRQRSCPQSRSSSGWDRVGSHRSKNQTRCMWHVGRTYTSGLNMAKAMGDPRLPGIHP